MYKVASQAGLWYNRRVKNVVAPAMLVTSRGWIHSLEECIMTTVPDSTQNSNVPQKKCLGPCGRSLPATTDFFFANRTSKNGLDSKCKQCRQSYKKCVPPDLPEGQKQCSGPCQRILPATSEYFVQDKYRPDGLTAQCKECRHPRKISDIPDGQRQCKKCKYIYPATSDYFCRDKYYKGGLKSVCKQCTNKPLKKDAPEGYRRCTQCKEVYPATTDYFYSDKRNQYGIRSYCKECHNKEGRSYYGNHLVEQKQYRDSHQDRRKVTNREYLEKNHDKVIAQTKSYRERNKEAVKERSKRYYQTENGQIVRSINSHKRRSRKHNASGRHSIKELQEQKKRQKGCCYYCHIKLGKGKNTSHADHIIPLSRGGTNDISNIVITCPSCNLKKNNKMLHEWTDGGRLL